LAVKNATCSRSGPTGSGANLSGREAPLPWLGIPTIATTCSDRLRPVWRGR
jgi:hypothetical protein